jgi:DNA-binding CsgD family transcriptional regulator
MYQQVFGRDAELAAIADFLTALVASARGLVLAGPAGQGKTTLLRAAVAAAAERGYTVLETSPARSEVRLAFAGLTDLLEGRLGGIADDLPASQVRALRVALLEEEAPANPPEPRLIAAAFRSALAALAVAAPVLVAIDDVQWLDQPSQAAIGFAGRRLQSERVGLLCAQRTDRPGAELPLELDRARLTAGLLPVGALTIGALRRMLRTRLGSSFSQPTLRRIEAQSGGNPFIALELGRALVRHDLTAAGNTLGGVPDTLSGLVNERLGDLQSGVLDAVQLVAVMPDAPAAHYVTAATEAAHVDAAVMAGVLEQDGGRLRFSHPLLASAVSAAIPPARLRELHAIASHLVQLPEARARHRALAAAGPSATVAADLDAAARGAAAQGAPSNAAELFGLAASLTPDDQVADATRRRLDAAQQLEIAGETHGAIAALEALIESMPAGPARAKVLITLAGQRYNDYAAGVEHLRQALAEAGDDPALAAEIHFMLSSTWSKSGDWARSRDEAWQSVALAQRSAQPALLATYLAQAFEADMLYGTEDERDLDRALELERTAGNVPQRISPTQVAAPFYMAQGRLEEAAAAWHQELARAQAGGIEILRCEALHRLSRVVLRQGDAQRAAGLAAEGLEIAEQLDYYRPIVSALYACVSAALHLGEATQVSELARRGLELARPNGDKPYLIGNQASLGSLDLARGDYPAAAARLGPLTGPLLEIRWYSVTQNVAPDLAEALIATGELDGAAAFIAEMERGMRDPLTAALMARSRGLLTAARGHLGTAIAEVTESLRLHDLISPHPLEQGRALLVLGTIQRRLKLRATARDTLSEAARVFTTIGAPLWAAKARDELSRIGGRSPGPVELTATEQRVAELVASGRSNKEAAAELFVTVRAIESTLTKAYAKLGVRSRTELAARLDKRG